MEGFIYRNNKLKIVVFSNINIIRFSKMIKILKIFIHMKFQQLTKLCEECGNKLILKNNRDIIKKRFCSRKCLGKWTSKLLTKSHYKKMIKMGNTEESNRKKGHKKEKHPLWKGGDVKHECKICKKQFFIPINRHNKGYGICCSKECWKHFSFVPKVKSSCLNCGKDIFDLPKKNRKYCSCSCRMIHLLPKQKSKETKIELKIRNFLKEKKISFCFQPHIKGIVNADFSIGSNILIFADGDYWHSLPKAVKRDNIVNNKLKENNYIVLRFSEKEINTNFSTVENKIMEVLNARS